MSTPEFQVGERVEILYRGDWCDARVMSKRDPYDGEYFCKGGEDPDRICGWVHYSKMRMPVSAPRALTEAAHACVRERNEAVERAKAAEAERDKAVKQLNEMTAARDNALRMHADVLGDLRHACVARDKLDLSLCNTIRERDIARAALPPLETSLKLHEATVAAQAGQLEDAKAENERAWGEVRKLQARLADQIKDSKDRPLLVAFAEIDQKLPNARGEVGSSILRLRGTRAARPGLLSPFTVWDAMRGVEDAEVHIQFDDAIIRVLREVVGTFAPPEPVAVCERDPLEKQLEHHLADKRSGTRTHVPVSRATIENCLGALKARQVVLDGVRTALDVKDGYSIVGAAEIAAQFRKDYSDQIGTARTILGANATEGLVDIAKRVGGILGWRGGGESVAGAAKRVFAEAEAARSARGALSELAEDIKSLQEAMK